MKEKNKESKKSKNKQFKKGFTLIEMLVVVLIIGILVGIALPQYQLAVDKADFANMQEMASAIKKAYQHYFLIHNKATKNFDDLDLDFPNNTIPYTNSAYNCLILTNMFCCMSKATSQSSGDIFCGKNDLSFLINERVFGYNYVERNKRYCYALQDNTRGNRLCTNVGTNTNTTDNAWTPQGNKYIYNVYRL